MSLICSRCVLSDEDGGTKIFMSGFEIRRELNMEKKIHFDNRLESYDTFMKGDFPEQAERAAGDVPALEEPVFDLLTAWQSASSAGVFPKLMITNVKDFHDSFVNSQKAMPQILRYSDAIMGKLIREIPALTEDRTLRFRLNGKISALAIETMMPVISEKIEMDAEKIWEEYLKLPPFQMGLQSTMRLIFLAVYSAYEDFLVRAVSIALPEEEIRTNEKKFKEHFIGKFGVDLYQEACDSSEMKTYRFMRNSFMHAGGRMTPDLKKCSEIPAKVCDTDETLHIFPEHIRRLYETFKGPVLKILQAKCFREQG